MPTLQQKRLLLGRAGAAAVPLLPFTDAFTRADGAIGNGWTGATWTISGNKAINTPTLGSELLAVTDFATDTVWTKGTGWTISGGVASHAVSSSSTITQNVATSGQWYKLVWTLLNWSASGFNGRVGNTSLTQRSANGTYIDTIRASASSTGVQATQSGSIGDIDNVSCKQLTLATLFATQNFGRADVDISAKATIVSGNNAGVVLSLDSASSPANFVIAYHDGVNAHLDKCVGGTYTSVINTAATYSAGATIRATKVGTTYALYYNGSQIGTNQTISDAGIINNTMAGMFATNEGNSLDDFSIA